MFAIEFFEVIRDFMDQGGGVLWLILLTLVLLWSLVIERYLFYRRDFPKYRDLLVEQWNQRADKSSWYAQKIREATISRVRTDLRKNIPMIKTLVALCPLLGLLGTVTGMIAVFDVMAETGTGNARLMASGISMATIPTMSGMVAALSGLYFGSLLESRAKKENQLIDEYLLGDIHLEQKIKVPANETIEIDFSLPFQLMQSEMDEYEDSNIVFGGLVKAAKWFSSVKSTYRIEATAKVKGVALDPFNKKMVELK